MSLKNNDIVEVLGPNFDSKYSGIGIDFSKTDGDKYDEYVKKIFDTNNDFKSLLAQNAKNNDEINLYYVMVDVKGPTGKGGDSPKKGGCQCYKK